MTDEFIKSEAEKAAAQYVKASTYVFTDKQWKQLCHSDFKAGFLAGASLGSAQLKDLHQQLSSLKASMDILVDDKERVSKRGMRWVKANPEKLEDMVIARAWRDTRDGAIYGAQHLKEITETFGNYWVRFSFDIYTHVTIHFPYLEYLDESIIPKGEEREEIKK